MSQPTIATAAATGSEAALARATFRLAACLFFIGGAVSLVYQTLWVSWWVHVFGAGSYAIATVLAAFMAGLGLGSWLFGRFADRKFDHLAAYGIIEICIGLYALLLGGFELGTGKGGGGGMTIPRVIELLEGVYAPLYNARPDAVGLQIAVRFALSFLVLLPATTMMGATLPMLAKHLVGRLDTVGSRVGTLYAMNTFGAVAGTLLAGFVFIEVFGRSLTNTYMVAANLGIGAIALAWSALFPSGPQPAPASPAPGGSAPPTTEPAGGSPASPMSADGAHGAAPRETPALSPWQLRVLLLGFAISGATAMVYEVAWARLTGLILGSSCYSFTIMLATFLVGIAWGSRIAGRMLERRPATLVLFAGTQLGVGLGTAAVVWFGEFLPVVSLWLLPFRKLVNDESLVLTFAVGLVPGIAVCVAMMIVPALFLGACFPVAVQAYSRSVDSLGRSIGTVYGCNTAGCIVGSIVGGFLLMPALGLHGTMATACTVNLLAAAGLAVAGLPFFGRSVPAASTDKSDPAPAAMRSVPSAGFGAAPVRAWLGGGLVAAVALLAAIPTVAGRAWDGLLMNYEIFTADDDLRNVVTAHGITGVRKGLADLRDHLGRRHVLLYERDGINSTVTVMCMAHRFRERAIEDLANDAVRGTEVKAAVLEIGRRKLAKLADDSGRLEEFVRMQDELRALAAAPLTRWKKRLDVVVRTLRETVPPDDAKGADAFENAAVEAVCEVRETFTDTTVAVVKVTGTRRELCPSRHLRNNGKTDASDEGDMSTQLMVAYMPLFANPAAKDVCVIGMGSGTTVGAVGHFAGVKSIDCIELEPGVVAAARRNFSHRHGDFLADQRVRIFEQDGRNHLALWEGKYDVIINEPSNPWIAGIANLFSAEFYRHARDRMRPGGVLCQWLQLYQTDWADYLMVLRTMRSEFKHVLVLRVDPGDSADTLVLASDEPIIFDPAAMQDLVDSPSHAKLRSELAEWLMTDMLSLLHGVYMLGGGDLDEMLERWEATSRRDKTDKYLRLNTDDRLLLEFSAPRVQHHYKNAAVILGRLWKERTRRPAREGLVRTGATDWPPYLKNFEQAVARCDKERLAAELVRMGLRYMESSDWGEAADALEDALRLRPDSAVALAVMADLRSRQMHAGFKPAEARELWNRAAAARIDDWLLEPVDQHFPDSERRVAIADMLVRRCPESAAAYAAFAWLTDRYSDDPGSSVRVEVCRNRLAEMLTAAEPPRLPAKASAVGRKMIEVLDAGAAAAEDAAGKAKFQQARERLDASWAKDPAGTGK